MFIENSELETSSWVLSTPGIIMHHTTHLYSVYVTSIAQLRPWHQPSRAKVSTIFTWCASVCIYVTFPNWAPKRPTELSFAQISHVGGIWYFVITAVISWQQLITAVKRWLKWELTMWDQIWHTSTSVCTLQFLIIFSYQLSTDGDSR